MFGVVFDTEADSLTPTKFHVLSYWTEDGIKSTPDYQDIRDFFRENNIIVGHNITRWDLPNLKRVVDFDTPDDTLVIDTLALSWYLFPKEDDGETTRRYHGLEEWGEYFGIPKPVIKDWQGLTYEQYRHRCEEDVKINQMLWEKCYKLLKLLYGTDDEIKKFLRYLAFKMDCAREQEESRWKLDAERCRENIVKLEKLQDDKLEELTKCMPRVPIVKTRTKPVRAISKSGVPTKLGEAWYSFLREQGLPPEHSEPVDEIVGTDDPNPGSTTQVKKWLFDLGWKPQTFKKNKKGVPVPQISKLKQDGGGICDSIKELYDREPNLVLLDNLYVLGHRLGILRSFLDDCSDDGYVVARIQGLTNTLRFKHAEVVNLPKVDTPFGEDVRSCLIAPDGYELCGSDMSSLEDRTKQSYMWKYDPEYVKKMMTEDFDPHLDIAVVAKLMTKADSDFYKSFKPAVASTNDHARYKLLKTVRGIEKNTNYAGVYGAGPPRIAETAGISIKEAQAIHKVYWERNWSVKAVANSCKVKTIDGQMWLYNPVSTFWYSLRHEKDRFSTLNQGTGVYCFDTYVSFVRKQRDQLTAQFHDEIVLCVKKGFREEVSKILRTAIKQTNEFLELNRELDIGIDFGDNYGQIH